MAEKADIIRELKVEDAVLLPETVRAAVVAASDPAKLVAEMRTKLGLDDKGDVIAAVAGLVAQVAELNKTAVEAAIVTEVAGAIKVEDARGVVLELVKARKPATVEAVKSVVTEVADSETVKTLIQKLVKETMGDPQRRPLGNNGDGKGVDEFVAIPKEDKPE